MFRISEARVRSLRRDAALRHRVIDRKQALAEVASKLFEFGEVRTIADRGLVQLELDDPVLHRELERAARELGYFTDTSYNRNVPKIHVLVAIFAAQFKDVSKQVARIIEREERLLGGAHRDVEARFPMGERIERTLGRTKNRSNLLNMLLTPLRALAAGA